MTALGDARQLPRKFYVTYPLTGLAAVAGMWSTRTTMRTSLVVWWLAAVVVACVAIANAWWMFTVLTAPRRDGPARNSGVAAPVGLALVAAVVLEPRVGSATLIWFGCLAFLSMASAFVAFLLYRRVGSRTDSA